MRVKLHLKRLQLRLCQLSFQLRGTKLTFAIAKIVTDRITDAERRAVDQQVEVKLTHRAPAKHLEKRAGLAWWTKWQQNLINESSESCMRQRNDHASRQVYRQHTPPGSAFNGKAASQRQDDGRCRNPD